MTVEQCVLFLQSQAENRNEQFKEEAILLNGLSIQIVSGIAGLLNGKTKMTALEKLYPEMFTEIHDITSPQSQMEIWLRFLKS